MSLTVSIEPGPVDWEKGAGQDSRRGPREGQGRAGGCAAGTEERRAGRPQSSAPRPGVSGVLPSPHPPRHAPHPQLLVRVGVSLFRATAWIPGSGPPAHSLTGWCCASVERSFVWVICHVFDSMLRFSVFFFFLNRSHCFPRGRGGSRAFINFAATHLPAFTFSYVNLAWFYCII